MMSQVSHLKTDEELVTVFIKMTDHLKALKFSDEQGRVTQVELIQHCKKGLELIKQKYTSNDSHTTLRPGEFHNQHCECNQCGPLTGCDR